MKSDRPVRDPDGPAKAAYQEWRQWHGTLSATSLGLPQWRDLLESRKGLWRRIAAAARSAP